MDPHVLHSQLVGLLARIPSFDNFSPASADALAWLGQAHALISRWDRLEAVSIRSATDFLGLSITRDANVAKILSVLHRAAADLELQMAGRTDQAFGPGAVYDFFTALRDVIGQAERQLLIVDPYVDASVFDAYLPSVRQGVEVRLLTVSASADLVHAGERFAAQYGTPLKIRLSKAFHDRVLFVDGTMCWVVGQSIKDAARQKPTYLAPLSMDVAIAKLEAYEDVWAKARPI